MAPAASSRASGLSPTLAVFLNRSHAPEYVGIGVLLTLYLTVIVHLQPFHRMFYINNLAISFPHAQVEHVSVYIIKNAVGRPRPDLLDRCKPAEGTPRDTLVGFDVCTAAAGHSLTDGWRSFPSGHSSFAFSGLGFLALWLAGQLHIFNARGRRNLAKAIVCLAPLMGALLIAISRCEDYRHDVYDVTVGSAIGATVAYWSYRRHFPTLSFIDCDEPYAAPADSGLARAEFTRLGDEEALTRGQANTI